MTQHLQHTLNPHHINSTKHLRAALDQLIQLNDCPLAHQQLVDLILGSEF